MDLEAFRTHLSSHPWHEIEAANSIDEAVSLWETFINGYCRQICPYQEKTCP